MLGRRIFIFISTILVAISSAASAQNFANPSFENSYNSWTTYNYQMGTITPSIGTIGSYPATFYMLSQGLTAPDGTYVCGVQTGAGQPPANCGVTQVINWQGGPAEVVISARAYSNNPDPNHDSDCRVRLGIAHNSPYRLNAVWSTSMWGNYFQNLSASIPSAGTYAIFIESYQPNTGFMMSTLWDNVRIIPQQAIYGWDILATTPGDDDHADSTALVTWATDIAGSSVVHYGTSPDDLNQTATGAGSTTTHSVSITGLQPSTTYYFRVSSVADGYIDFVSDQQTFTTAIQFTNIVSKLTADGENVEISWTTDVQTKGQVEYGLTDSYGSTSVEEDTYQTDHTAVIPLTPDKTYHFRVLGKKIGCADAHSEDMTFHSLPAVSASLQNGSFEETAPGHTSPLYPWVQYDTLYTNVYRPIDGVVGPYPASGTERWYGDIFAYDGSNFLGASASYTFKGGGVFQRVSVIPGQYYTLSAHFVTMRTGLMRPYTLAKLGIDPDGGVDSTSSTVSWWNGPSITNDNTWFPASITVQAGSTGIMTVFAGIFQQFAQEYQIVAIDDVQLERPAESTIGQLKATSGSLGAVLTDKIISYVDTSTVNYANITYRKVYVQEDNRSAGIAVLLPSSETPTVGKKLTATGSLISLEMESVFLAKSYTIGTTIYDKPDPVFLTHKAIGNATRNQPAMHAKGGPCTVGAKVRICGKVTYAEPANTPGENIVAYIDDGYGVADQSGYKGIRVFLPARTYGIGEGDYIAVTGVVGIAYIGSDMTPELKYYTYLVSAVSNTDWELISQSPQ